MNPLRLLRAAVRPVLGRDRPIWRTLRSPRLRYVAFGNPVDAVIYSLLISLPRVRFIQIGSCDGQTNDPLWTFREYPNWSGVLVEPFEPVFRRLEKSYEEWRDRFTLVNVAVGPERGMKPFYHLRETDPPSDHHDQLGSMDDALVRRHASHFSLADEGAVVVSQVRCVTLADLCDAHEIATLDVVHIDAEGSDAVIIEQFDFERYDPTVVLYEQVHLSQDEKDAALGRLSAYGYEAVSLGTDALAVRRAEVDRLPALRTAWRMVEIGTR
jgi:FkbM family methyltransferase